MALLGVVITYNDYPQIVDCIDSFQKHVDEIICVDGRYSDFPGKTDFSTDGTTEYLKSVDKVRLAYASGIQEVDKRNIYLVGKPGDWYFHLDADEVWKGPLGIPKDADMGICKLQQMRPNYQNGKRIRLFRHIDGLHYEGKHYWLRDGEGKTFALLDKPGKNYKAKWIDGTIEHHSKDRPSQRQSLKRQYYRTLTRRENPIREVT